MPLGRRFPESEDVLRWHLKRPRPSRLAELVLCILATTMVAGSDVQSQQRAPGLLVGPEQLRAEKGQAVVVLLDVRDSDRYTAGHLPGAVRMSLERVTDIEDRDELRSFLGHLGLAGSETVVLYGGLGDQEALGWAFFLLEAAGVEAVKILDGGAAAWLQAGGDFETTPRQPPAVRFDAAPERAAVVEVTEVETTYGREDIVLLDVRSPEGWELYKPPPVFVAGHLPDALAYDFAGLLQGKTGWPNPGEAKTEFARLGPRPDTPIDLGSRFILYGDDSQDRRVGLAYTLLRLLGLDVRVYRGGWQEWTGDDGRPVVRIITARELREIQAASPSRSAEGYYPLVPIIDVRELRDWEVGHVPGSFGLPADECARFLELVRREYWPSADPLRHPLVLYCYGPECVRSRDCAVHAARIGWREILWFRDGVAGWFDAGNPFERVGD